MRPRVPGIEDEQVGADWEVGDGPVLDASGRVERIQPAPASPSSVRGDPPAPEQELELARDIRREAPPPSEWASLPEPSENVRPRRSNAAPFFAIGTVVALAACGWFFGPELWLRLQRQLPLGVRAEPAILRIDSEPSGARVKVGDAELGITPLRMDNLWPAGRRVELEVVLDGYEPWRGTIEGGRAQSLEAKLRRGRTDRRR